MNKGEQVSKLKEIKTSDAPAAIGPYSQAVMAGGFIFCSGQIGLDPKTNALVSGGVQAQARQIMENLSAVLKAAGHGLEDVLRAEIFLVDMDDYGLVNEIYGSFFSGDPKSARQTVAVSALPKGAAVEISCIAYGGKA